MKQEFYVQQVQISSLDSGGENSNEITGNHELENTHSATRSTSGGGGNGEKDILRWAENNKQTTATTTNDDKFTAAAALRHFYQVGHFISTFIKLNKENMKEKIRLK